MSVTSHYIDNLWQLRNHMIRFVYVPAPHSSERLAKFLIDCLMDWNVDYKLSTVILVQNLFSGSIYPTANLFFPRVFDMKLKLMEWRPDNLIVIRDMVALMFLKFLKYWSIIHTILVVSVILYPRYKFHIIEYYSMKFGSEDASFDKDGIKTILYDLVHEYQIKLDKNGASSSFGISVTSIVTNNDNEVYVTQRKMSRTSTYKTELDNYLTEYILPLSSDFDMLFWW
ncbi:Putative AC9 transposase [Linum perenne]